MKYDDFIHFFFRRSIWTYVPKQLSLHVLDRILCKAASQNHCLKKGSLLWFQQNSTATSNGCMQKAWKWSLVWFWIYCNQSFAAKTVANEKQCLQTMYKTSVDWTSFNFPFQDFLGILLFLLLKIIAWVYCISEQPSIPWSWRSVLNFKLSVFTFLRLMTCSSVLEEYWAKIVPRENITTPIFVSNLRLGHSFPLNCWKNWKNKGQLWDISEIESKFQPSWWASSLIPMKLL